MKLLSEWLKKSGTDKPGNKKLFLGTLFIEIISIVLAVLLALAVDEWRENRANAQLARETLSRIIVELKLNVTELEDITKKHQAMHDQLEGMLDKMQNKVDLSGIDFNFNIQLGVLHRSAWQTAIFTQAFRHMDFQVVQELSEIYEVHDFYKVHLENIIKNLSSANLFFEEHVQAQFSALLQDIKTAIDLEKGLLTLHQKFLKKHKL
jgi:hypothetical protein